MCLSDVPLGFTFDLITEKGLVEHLNQTLERNATILTYEMQIRYRLRPDLRLLSLDGVTDGKVAPYLESGDMTAFLKKYKPQYWLANDAVNYRPYLSTSILRPVMEKAGQQEGRSLQVEGITFTNVRTRKEPLVWGFAGYKQLYRLTYE
jgi:hypothetical protein